MVSSRSAWPGLAVASVLAVGVALLVAAPWQRETPPAETVLSTSALMAETANDASFARALEPRPFSFPRDHGAHDAFRTEWWYFTGHLGDEDGGEYGFQLTLFRFELDDRAHTSPSAWRTPRVFLGHFAVTDVSGECFHAFERMSRALPGIATVTGDPPAVRLDDWTIAYVPDAEAWRLTARQGDTGLTLRLQARTAPVAQGEDGLSQKSAAAGNASYYYSVPHLAATGELMLDGRTRAVSGNAWLDREWSTSALDRAQSGWDWFALQFEDGASLMFYRLRRAGGATDPHSAGTWMAPDGRVRRLAADDVTLTALDTWQSPVTARRYPSRTRLTANALDLDVVLTPRVADQEWRGRFRYWEGAAAFAGTRGGTPVAGRAYMELTGY